MTTAVYMLSHYAVLGAILLACWGTGRMAMARLQMEFPSPVLAMAFSTAVGLGLAICLLQALGIAGLFNRYWITALGLMGFVMGLTQALSEHRRTPSVSDRLPATGFGGHFALACLVIAIASLLVRPLSPPLAWDELMYHLPHARQWAESGRLQVNAPLRYPWFPYNFDLLYAAALVFGNDVMPHLLHASAGWLTAWMIYGLGTLHLNRAAGCLAAVLWLVLTKAEFENAYIDMGVTLFVLCAAVAFQQACSTAKRRWLIASGFLLGIALGSKYQALGLLPFFAAALLVRDRRTSTWLVAIAATALPCIYWYARNFISTGDPFNPIGGPFFGFNDWDTGDYRAQFDDLRRNAALPHWALWPALLAPCVPTLRRSPGGRQAMWLSAWMLIVWWASSRYPRYLMPAYPLLALLSVGTCLPLFQRLASHWPASLTRAAAWLLLGTLSVAAGMAVHKQTKRLAATPAAREQLLRAEVNGYGMWEHLRLRPAGRLYQLGLEDSLYYAPQPVWGDVFGPWRYRDVQDLSAPALHRKLSAEGFDALVVDTSRFPDVATRPGFTERFELLHADDHVRLYRLLPISPTLSETGGL